MNNNYPESMNIFAEMGDSSSVTVCNTLCDKKMTVDLSGEFSLPDYLPEMRRLVRVTVTPTAPSKFISGNSVQLGGGVDYNVCYVGADGRLYGTSFPGEYSLNAAFDPDVEYDVHHGITAEADISAASVVGRVVGARKLSLKTRLIASIIALGSAEERLAEWASDPAHSHTQKLMKRVECHKRLVGSNDEIVLRDTLDAALEGARYVSSDCGVFIEEVRGGDGYVDCRGTVKVRYLLCRESDGAPFVVEKRYPLSETVELDGMKDGARATAFGTCTGIDVASDGIDGGDNECTIRIRILAQGFVGEQVSYVNDAYSTVYDTACEMKTVKLPTVCYCGLKNMTFDTVVPLDKLGIDRAKGEFNVVSTSVNASVGEWEFSEDGKKAAVNGSVCFNMLYSVITEEGSAEISSAETELPFKIDGFDTDAVGKTSLCSASALDPRVKIGAGELELGCEIALSCAATSEVNTENVLAVNILGETAEKRSGISLCFPGNDESLWSVAKKYRVLADQVRNDNRISTEFADDDARSLENVRYLIV